MNLSVTIPPVRTFAHVEADKAQALKPLEEAAEVFAAWQARMAAHERHYDVVSAGVDLVNECCDVIMATCNLLAAIGVTDLTEAMAACEERNRERGRYERANGTAVASGRFPAPPLFGNRRPRSSGTHWIVFSKGGSNAD